MKRLESLNAACKTISSKSQCYAQYKYMTSPIYPIETIEAGSLSAMAKPNAKGDIEAEFKSIAARNITRVVSLLESTEAAGQGLANEKREVERCGMQFVHYPIGDFGVPENIHEFALFIRQEHQAIVAGEHTVVHCYAGIGRTGIVTTSILLRCGYNPLQAIDYISKKRGMKIPDTQRQIDWICDNQQAIHKA